MAENQPDTPEKQLLRLIENPKQPVLKVEEAKRQSKKWFSLNALKGRISFWSSASGKQWFSFKSFTKSGVGLRQINLALRMLIICLAAFLVYYVVQMSLELKKASNLILNFDGRDIQFQEGIEPEVKNLSYYLEKVSGRNLFNITDVPAPQIRPGQQPVLTKKEVDRTKDFSLVGISWSSDPEAMIEDSKNKRTYFMKRGQALDDEIRVVTIFRDKVILTYNNKEFELR
jgi:hypothetical protein